ncbi:prepilin peptidase [Deltaproteobacteria bacterium Smac51]|nr:prepilin peptidase [Deltaproteobacteria bacterium Smac51]
MDYIIAIYILIFAFGLSVGSFLNVVIYRLPRESLSVSKPTRSFCPVCGKPIRWYDNIPVLSWLILKARCRDCGEPIGARYPLVELASGLLAVYLYYHFGPSLNFFFYFYFVMCLLAIALIDLELMVIPTALMYPPALAGLLCAVLEPSVNLPGPWLWMKVEPLWGPRAASLAGSLAGLVLGWGSLKAVSVGYKLARGHDGMGDGDPPLLGMIGAFLGWQAIPVIILGSTIIGLASVGIMMLISKKSPDEGWGLKALPFGPFLVLASFFYLFFGPALVNWYLSMIL